MPIILIFAGSLLLGSAIAGTTADLAKLLRADLTGRNSFLYWLAALGIIGALGFVPKLTEFSRSFMVLIVLGMVLRNGTGVFARLNQAISSPPTPQKASDTETLPSSSGSGGSGGSGGSAGSGGSGSSGSSGSSGGIDISTIASVAALALL